MTFYPPKNCFNTLKMPHTVFQLVKKVFFLFVFKLYLLFLLLLCSLYLFLDSVLSLSLSFNRTQIREFEEVVSDSSHSQTAPNYLWVPTFLKVSQHPLRSLELEVLFHVIQHRCFMRAEESTEAKLAQEVQTSEGARASTQDSSPSFFLLLFTLQWEFCLLYPLTEASVRSLHNPMWRVRRSF